jgi:UDP-N-acetylmuramoyl-tripeptide--D-alanyl-D-alanine ligase
MSVSFRADELASWTGGTLLQGDAEQSFAGVTINSRSVSSGELFVAIRGPHHDGHDYIQGALRNGAGGALVARGTELPSLPDSFSLIAVEDTTAGLGALAAAHRRGFDGPLVAITGSSGKTTTKELCAAILENVAPCLRTQGNLNNQYGLPLTLLRREPEDRFAVVEIGMNHPGEIAPLAAIAAPTIAIITNVGTAHIEFMGSAEAIAEEKGSLLEALQSEHFAILNADDPLVLAQAGRTAAKKLCFGTAAGAEIRASEIERSAGAFQFQLHTPSGTRSVRVPGASETLIPNSLGAAAAAFAAGASLEQIEAGLASYAGVAGRMQLRRAATGTLLIDDTYNANPQSMHAALRSLTALAKEEGRTPVAVLGDMGELGDTAAQAHRQIGEQAAASGVVELIAVGGHSREVAEGALSGGLCSTQIDVTHDTDEAVALLEDLLGPDDIVLVKGSRAMRMERIVEALSAGENA